MSDLEQLTARLAELENERDALTSARTKEDVRALAESWLAAACARMNGTPGLVLNGHANPDQVHAVLAEFLLDSPALLDFIVRKVEATTELTNRQRDSRLRKLGQQIDAATAELREARKQAALAELEREFAGEAA
jgi:hypothetical protein